MAGQRKQTLLNDTGASLIGVVVLIFAISAFGIAYLRFGGYEAESIQRANDRLRAFWKAEEGLSKGRAELKKNGGTCIGKKGFTFQAGSDTGFFAQYRFVPASNNALAIESDAFSTKNPTECLVHLRLMMQAQQVFYFHQIFDVPGEPTKGPFFDTGDTIDGDIHSNSYFLITGFPVFMKSVTAVYQNPMRHLPLASYDQSLEKRISGNASPLNFSNMADSIKQRRTIHVPPYTRACIELTQDGKLTWRYRDLMNPQVLSAPNDTVIAGPKFGLYFDGDVEIKGTLKGSLTIGSSSNIYITDDLVYAESDPQTGRPPISGGSFLGLIAQKNVKVNQEQEGHEIGQGIKINGVIVALDKSFEVINYRKYNQSMGVMRLWGSVVQKERGVVGSWRLRHTMFQGYTKSWHYDPRLKLEDPQLVIPPLSGGGAYTIIAWERVNVQS